MPLREITSDDIESLAVGAWVLGTGGGGSPYLGLLNMRALYREGYRVQLMPASELADDDWVAAVSNMGAPLVGQERLTDSRTIARAVELMESHIGHSFRGIMALEIGGGNSIQPLMAAAHLKRPVIDSDMMGRAYPEAQMTSMAVGDLVPCPLTSVDVRGLESVVGSVPTWKWMERVSRKICAEYGSIASTCKAPRTGAEVKKWGIHGTTTKAIAIGAAVREAQRKHEDPVAAILSVEPGKLLYKGKVMDVERRATEGFLRGRLRFDGTDEYRGATMEIAGTMSSFRVLSFLLLLSITWLPLQAADIPTRKPNVLLIYTDDHGWADLGIQGVDQEVRTPHLNQLIDDLDSSHDR